MEAFCFSIRHFLISSPIALARGGGTALPTCAKARKDGLVQTIIPARAPHTPTSRRQPHMDIHSSKYRVTKGYSVYVSRSLRDTVGM